MICLGIRIKGHEMVKKASGIVIALILCAGFPRQGRVAEPPRLRVTRYGTSDVPSEAKPLAPNRMPVRFAGMSADEFHRKTDFYRRLREDLGGKNSAAWERFIRTDQYKRYKAAARVYLSSTDPASPDLEAKKPEPDVPDLGEGLGFCFFSFSNRAIFFFSLSFSF